MVDRILLVDDEPRLLDGLRRTLRSRYTVLTASSGHEGLQTLENSVLDGDPITVIVSDMMMPGMNGAEFLTKAREIVPSAVRMILSGQADLTSTIAAVNNADLFRFLTKPIEPDELTQALDAALRQAQLLRAERELLEKTLGGAVDVLTEVLSMASPQASRRTARVRAVVQSVSTALAFDDDWRLPIAAMLSQIGCIAVPAPVLEKLDTGAELTALEQQMIVSHPQTGRRLLERIPRLAEVAEWVGAAPVFAQQVRSEAFARDHHNPDLSAGFDRHGAEITPLDIFVASVATLCLVDAQEAPQAAAHEMTRYYPARLMDAVQRAVEALSPRGVLREVPAKYLRAGMVFNADVLSSNGIVLVRKGEKVTEVLAERVANFANSIGLREPLEVLDLNEQAAP